MKTNINKKKKSKRGFLTVEVLIAVSIITVSVLAATLVTEKSVSVSRRAFHTTQAAFLLEEGAENVRIGRDNDWANIEAINSGSPEQIGIFERTTLVSDVTRDATTDDIGPGVDDPGTKLITVTVSWSEGGQVLTKTLRFYIMDIFS